MDIYIHSYKDGNFYVENCRAYYVENSRASYVSIIILIRMFKQRNDSIV